MNLETMDTVVVTDHHGHVKAIEMVAEMYPGVRIIDAGDRVDGKNTSRYMQAAGELGVLSTIGNHEWVQAAVLQAGDEYIRDVFMNNWRSVDSGRVKYEQNVLESYGVDSRLPNYLAIKKLYGIMWRSGHLDLLNSSQTYYETDDFIVVHAGLTDEPWEQQRKDLDDAKQRFDEFDYVDMPIQIFDTPAHDLSLQADDFTATEKTVITGHTHLDAKASERVSSTGRRIRLASRLAIGDPVFVWQSWDGQVVEIGGR